MGSKFKPTEIAEKLAKKAFSLSVDPTYWSPFSKSASVHYN